MVVLFPPPKLHLELVSGAYGFKRSTLEFVHVSNDCLVVMYYWLEKRRRVGTEEATLYDRILSAAKRATVGTLERCV